MRKMSTHQAVRLSCWIDSIESKQRIWSRCASKAFERGKQVQGRYWSDRAMRAESALTRLRRRLLLQ